MPGGVVSRYCNICNRMITPREIETGQAIVYGTYYYCSKCKKEVMPIVEAIKRRLEEAEKKEEKEKVEVEPVVEFIEPPKSEPKRTRTPRPFRLKRRHTRRHRTGVAKTEIFLKRQLPRAKQRPPVAVPVAQPADRVEEEVKVTEDGIAVEPIDLDSIERVGEEVPLKPGAVSVGGRRIELPTEDETAKHAEPHRAHYRPSHPSAHARSTVHHRPSPKKAPPLPQERIVPVHHAPKHSRTPYIILLLIVLAIVGGLAFYYGYYLPGKAYEEQENERKAQEEERRKKREERRLLDDLNKKLHSVKTLSDYRELSKAIIDAENTISAPDHKRRLAEIKRDLNRWFKTEAERIYVDTMNRYRRLLSIPETELSALLSVLHSYPEEFAEKEETKKWRKKLQAESEKVKKTQSILERYEALLPALKEKEKAGKYKEALRLLDSLVYSPEEVLDRFLRPIVAERKRLTGLLKGRERAEAERRERALKAYRTLMVDVKEALEKKDFERAEEMLKEFLREHPNTEVAAEADSQLSVIGQQKRKWVLANLFNGSSLKYLRIKSREGYDLRKRTLVIEPEKEDFLAFFGYEDMRNIEVLIEFVLFKGSFRLFILSRKDDISSSLSQEVRYPLVQMNMKMRISITTTGRKVLITFLHNNMTLPTKEAPNSSGSLGILVPKGSRLYINRITIKED